MLHDDFGFVGLLKQQTVFHHSEFLLCSDFFLFNMSLYVFYVNMSFFETQICFIISKPFSSFLNLP